MRDVFLIVISGIIFICFSNKSNLKNECSGLKIDSATICFQNIADVEIQGYCSIRGNAIPIPLLEPNQTSKPVKVLLARTKSCRFAVFSNERMGAKIEPMDYPFQLNGKKELVNGYNLYKINLTFDKGFEEDGAYVSLILEN